MFENSIIDHYLGNWLLIIGHSTIMSEEKDLSKLEETLGVKFQKIDNLRQALVHRSYINEHPSFHLGHNERLEFLGDAVLELVVTEHLYDNFDNPEGELTNWRAALVNAEMNADMCIKLDVDDYLYLSKGESKDTDSKARRYILANAFEAIIGAIYEDQGWDVSKEFITRTNLAELPRILEQKLYIDPKSRFQEASQDRFSVTPSYKVLEESGPDHNKKFVVGVYLNKELIAEGEGTSKHEGQVAAAAAALEKKGW